MQNKVTQKTDHKGLAKSGPKVGLALIASCLAFGPTLRADMVTDWNANTEQALLTANQGPPVRARSLAIVHAAIYDAVNGIQHQYTPYFVTERGPRGASAEAAAAQAAYTALVSLYPAQNATLDVQLANSLATIPSHRGHGHRIDLGRAWGEEVANQILAWRSTDGSATPLPGYFGGGAPGVWRSPPAGTNADGTLPALFPQYAMLVPFAMTSHAQFRPGPPPALTSALYAADVNEVKAIGRFNSAIRTSDQTQLALLWQAVGPVEENHIVRPVIETYARHSRLVDTARIFALINIVGADALIAGFDSKYTYNLWRPYHAIRLADTDGNPDTVTDPTWDSLFTAPRFQEYMSNHATITTAIMITLAELLGDEHTFILSGTGYPNFTWTFNRFSDAAAQVKEARIWAGIHFRNSCNVGAEQGMKLSRYVLENFLLPLDDEDDRDRN
ncbi:MAG TPA: vanadium-dependent haloperoxidase [Candidatus Acidoferrum sp.]|jgi:hypothetical protein|nr:vanadium-dependent haloperoxidase [Candidatus Acidoferrum sp.]